MKNLLLLSIFLLGSTLSFGQNELLKISPSSQSEPDLSKEAKKEIERQNLLLEKGSLTKTEKVELDSLLHKYGEVVQSVWDIFGSECSWYCGGGNYSVTASSSLKAQSTNIYKAKSANDLSYRTAWVEGKKDSGIGEHLEYSFKNNSPRITSIIISNGYMKSEKIWKNNNRVKSILLHVNGVKVAILKLTDTKTDQTFEVGTLGHNDDGSDLVLRFEILEIYKGDKFDDTAITEIYFDGIDVH